MLHKVLLLDLMAVAHLLIGTEEEEEAGGDILVLTTTNIMGNLTVATMRVPPGIITIAVVAIASSRSQHDRTSDHDRLDANFAALLGTLHNNVHSLYIMGIKPRPTSPLVML
jgi:hypothetical protein